MTGFYSLYVIVYGSENRSATHKSIEFYQAEIYFAQLEMHLLRIPFAMHDALCLGRSREIFKYYR